MTGGWDILIDTGVSMFTLNEQNIH
jgi:hypothetical protein